MTADQDAPATRARQERSALRLSLGISMGIAAAAVVIGVVAGSRIIVFDGVYLVVGLLLTWASLAAARAVVAGPTRRFPFGRDALAPLVVVAQGLGIAAALVIAAADAVIVIRDGGSEANAWAIGLYGAATAAIGFAVAAVLTRRASHSDIVRAEAAQWRSGSVLSVIMVAGALVSPLLRVSPLPWAARYLDPVLVLVACAVLAVVPVRLLRAGLNELLEGAPDPQLASRIQDAVEAVRHEHALPEPIVRSGKVGPKLYVEVDFVVSDPEWAVADEDAVRRDILARLRPLGLDVWAYVSVTHDRGLVE